MDDQVVDLTSSGDLNELALLLWLGKGLFFRQVRIHLEDLHSGGVAE